ncbi:MAG: hypothetical protein ABID79_01270 [Elusimicrobiota bacterium]
MYSQLRKNIPAENINFWRTNKQQEIDFIVDYDRNGRKRNFCAIEVKNVFRSKYTAHLMFFKREYRDAELYYCCMEKNEPSVDKRVNVIYPWEIELIYGKS